MAVILTIADAVVDALNGATFDLEFTATRAYVPVVELPELPTLTVVVVPRELSFAALSRRDDDFTYRIGISVQQKFSPPGDPEGTLFPTNTNIDARMTLCEQIIDLFRNKPLAGVEGVRCYEIENTPIYAPGDLDGMHLFSSIIILSFRLVRAWTDGAYA